MNSINKIEINLLGLNKGDKVLDIGCARGEQAIKIAKLGFEVYGIDSSVDYINTFKETLKDQKINCHPQTGLATKLPYDSNFFDAVVSTEVFEHIKDVKSAIDESFRVLRPGGKACISVPTARSEKLFVKIHPFWLKDSQHVNIFTKKNISSLLTSAGFQVEKIKNKNFEWTLFWLLHSFFKTRFDDTGSPINNSNITIFHQKLMHYLSILKLYKPILGVGNGFLPKSYYIYLRKPDENQ